MGGGVSQHVLLMVSPRGGLVRGVSYNFPGGLQSFVGGGYEGGPPFFYFGGGGIKFLISDFFGGRHSPPPPGRRHRNTVNVRPVRILDGNCILVIFNIVGMFEVYMQFLLVIKSVYPADWCSVLDLTSNVC